MKNHLKILIAAGLLILLLPLFGYVAITGAAPDNLIKRHQESKDISNVACRSCHGKVVDAAAGTSGNVLNAHKRHAMSVFLNFASNYVPGNPAADISMGCAKCHQATVYGDDEADVQKTYEADGSAIRYIDWGNLGGYEGDLSYITDTDTLSVTTETTSPNDETGGGNAPVRKKVNVQFCRRCHGRLGLGSASSHNNATYFTTETVSAPAGGTVVVATPLNPRGCVVAGSCHVSGITGGSGTDAHGAGPWSGPDYVGAGVWWIDQRYANSNSNCYRCHGELSWYDTDETNP